MRFARSRYRRAGNRFTIIAIIGLRGPFLEAEQPERVQQPCARERLNLHRRLKIIMIRRRSERRAPLNATCIPFAISGRGRMINNAGPIRYTPWYKRNTRANREAEARDVGHDRGWRKDGGERGPDVSNEYLIANLQHFQRIPRLSAERMRAPLGTAWAPRALSRTDATVPLPTRSTAITLAYAQTRDSFERGVGRGGNTFTFDRRSLPPEFHVTSETLSLGRNSRKNKRVHWQIKLLFRDIPLNLLLPNLHA